MQMKAQKIVLCIINFWSIVWDSIIYMQYIILVYKFVLMALLINLAMICKSVTTH